MNHRPSLEEIYRSEVSVVMHACRRMGVPERDLADVTHDVFLVVNRRLPSFDTARPLRPWLIGIAIRVARDQLRRGFRRYEIASDDDVNAIDAETSGPVALKHVLKQDIRTRVATGLRALDPDKRGVLLLHDAEGFTAPEIAAALGIPLNTVYSRLRLARERFAQALTTSRRQRDDTPETSSAR